MASFTRDSVDPLNLITSARIHELYEQRDAEDPLVLRAKAADFRKGYKNWRQKKPQGARGETQYLTDKDKLHAHDVADVNQLVIGTALEEVAPGPAGEDEHQHHILSPRGAAGAEDRPTLMRRASSFMNKAEVEHDEGENWLKFYVNPYSGMAEGEGLKEPVQLNQENLKVIPQSVLKPMYRRSLDKSFCDYYICHMGVGGFHRSHQAVYADDLLALAAKVEAKNARGGADKAAIAKWGIVGIGLMDWDRRMYDTLKKQDMLYTVLSRAPAHSEARVVGSILDFLFAPEDHQAVISKLAHEGTRIVTLTVTEKGYCQNVDGDLDQDNAFIKSDLEGGLSKPKTAIGMLLAGLRERKKLGVPSFTILSCDNLPENGDKLKHVVLQMAELVDPSLKAWVVENTTFPNTMVDRITPITEQEHVQIVADDHMVHDEWPVIAEDFRQWVVEDHFCNGRPDWDKVGALLVKDVRPYEFMKLRLLNGGHSAISYISYLCGYTYVDDAMADPLITAFLRGYFAEMGVTLKPVPGVDSSAYQDKLVERFGNPYIKDKLQRLAEDGSMKLKATMRDGLLQLHADGLPVNIITLAIAAWIRYMTGEDESGDYIQLKDPKAVELNTLAKEAVEGVASGEGQPLPERFLENVFGHDFVAQEGLVGKIKEHLGSVCTRGTKATLEAVMAATAGAAAAELPE